MFISSGPLAGNSVLLLSTLLSTLAVESGSPGCKSSIRIGGSLPKARKLLHSLHCLRLGIKLFSVVPSEMCNERTASKLTAMSTAKRNKLGPENLVRCAQLNQYWRYGFGSSEVQRHCQKVRLEHQPAKSRLD
ncbi:hypothetical protein B0H10DRAFT_1966656 [Mycena sp. CBHHK59/15]|nr:hypothetical protein B0H10DRAFT_1966656 [Mycena sp. CBHHK59/15]